MAHPSISTTLPREVLVWIQSLNLTYKISNPKRDLANGWLFAELLSRYHPDEIEMYQFDNGFKLEKKKNNWLHLQKFMNRMQIPVTPADWDPVMHAAPNAAYSLLKKFYTILTGREIQDELAPIQEQYMQDALDPEYAKPTIAKKMKERELVRIQDEKVKQDMAKTIINVHNETLREEKVTNPDRFTFTRTNKFEDDQTQQASRAKSFGKTKGASDSGAGVQTGTSTAFAGDLKQITVKTANKQIRGMRQGKKDGKGFAPNDDDNDEITFDYVLSDIIGSTLANKMGKNDPEYKNFKENFDQVNAYFIDRFNYIADELIHDIFTEVRARRKEIVTVVTKNMMDFCDLSQFFVNCLQIINSQVTSSGSLDGEEVEEENLFKMIVDTFIQLGNAILNEDPQQTELYFLEYCLSDILDIMCDNEFKRSQMAVILYCFCQNTAGAHMRVLTRIQQTIGARYPN